ncbi:MAG: ion transporter [Caulobacterales bacterium]
MAVAEAPAGRVARAKPKKKRRDGVWPFNVITGNFVWDNLILLCIIANAVALGLDANFGPEWEYHHLIDDLDQIFLLIFTVELAFEFLAQGPRKYFGNAWNIFDVIVVGICYVAISPAISALRTLRVLRVFRLVSAVPQMRRVVEALFGALPGILATSAILFVVFFIGSVMATTLFRGEAGFENLGQSALSLFALTQFDGWGDTIARLNASHPWAWAFLMSFTVIAAFAVLNLFIGVIVDAVQETRNEQTAEIKADVDVIEEGVEEIQTAQEDAAAVQKALLEEVRALRTEVAALRASNGSGQPLA